MPSIHFVIVLKVLLHIGQKDLHVDDLIKRASSFLQNDFDDPGLGGGEQPARGELANTAANAAAAAGSGITVGASDNIATLLYNSTGNVWIDGLE